MDQDVLIVGGGIGGAVLGLALGRAGWRVRIVEREAEPPDPPRPEILQESTLEALDALGIGARIRAEAVVRLRGFEIYEGDRPLVTVDEADLAAAGSRPLSTDPARTRALIIDAACATGNVTIRRGAEVTDLIRDGGHVAGARGRHEGGAFEERARIVAGDDGVRSVVRGALGIRAVLRLFPVEFIAFRIDRPPELPPDTAGGWLRPEALRDGLFAGLFVPLPGDRTAAVLLTTIGVWQDRFEGAPDAFRAELARLTPIAPALRTRIRIPEDLSRIRRAYGHAVSYLSDRGVILGDAAHPMSPAGGQGANAAIWDALALAEVLDDALRADDLRASRLLDYERRRRPANQRSLWFTRRAVTLIRLGRWLPGGGRFIVTLLRLAGRKRNLLRMAAVAFRHPSER